MGYGIYRIEKRTSNAVGGIKKENNRTKEDMEKYLEKHPGKTYLPNSDIDWSRTHLNYHFKKDEEWTKTIKEEIDGLGLKKRPRKDAIVLLDHFIGISPEESDRLSETELKAYFKDAYDHIEARYGHVVNAVVHMDEKTPHMHVVTVPITADGRLSAKELTSNEMSFRQVQDVFYQNVSKKYGLKRGEPKSKTKREHLTKQQKMIKELEEQVESYTKEAGRTEQEYIYNLTQRNAVRNTILDLQKEVTELEKRKDELQKELYGEQIGGLETIGLEERAEILRNEVKSLGEQEEAFWGIIESARDMFVKAIDFFFKGKLEQAEKWTELAAAKGNEKADAELSDPLKEQTKELVSQQAEELKVTFKRKRGR